jgi:hypothetical protein
VLRRIAWLLFGLALGGSAWATTYTYTGSNFNFVVAPYTTAMSITGSFTTASPLPANMAVTDIGPNGSNLVTAWSFTDSINTYTQANSVVLPQLGTFRIGTDATGSVTSFYIQLEQPLPPHTVGQLLNTVTIANFTLTQSQDISGAPCATLSGTVCATLNPGAAFGDSTSSGSFAPTIAPPTIAKSFGAASIAINTSTSLGFTLTNPNASASLSNVAFTDTLPAGLVVATPNGLTGSCGGGTITATAGSASVSLSGATLAGAGSCTFGVNVTGTALGTQANVTSAVDSTEGGTGSTASASLDVVSAPPPPKPGTLPAPIPTVQDWALVLISVLLGGIGCGVLWRRQRRASR